MKGPPNKAYWALVGFQLYGRCRIMVSTGITDRDRPNAVSKFLTHVSLPLFCFLSCPTASPCCVYPDTLAPFISFCRCHRVSLLILPLPIGSWTSREMRKPPVLTIVSTPALSSIRFSASGLPSIWIPSSLPTESLSRIRTAGWGRSH